MKNANNWSSRHWKIFRKNFVRSWKTWPFLLKTAPGPKAFAKLVFEKVRCCLVFMKVCRGHSAACTTAWCHPTKLLFSKNQLKRSAKRPRVSNNLSRKPSGTKWDITLACRMNESAPPRNDGRNNMVDRNPKAQMSNQCQKYE